MQAQAPLFTPLIFYPFSSYFISGEESSNKEGEGWSTYLGLWSGP